MNAASYGPFLNALLLLPFGIAIRMSLRLLYGARGPAAGDAIHQLINVIAWIFILAGLLAICFGTLMLPFVLLVILAHATLEMVIARRENNQAMAWSLVSGAIRSGQPLREIIPLGRQRLSGYVRRHFERFAADLDNGIATVDAIGRHPWAFPRAVQGHAALAKSGAIPLSTDLPQDLSGLRTAWSSTVHRLAYLFYTVLALMLIMVFYLMKIVPEFRKIFDEFELSLPQITVYFLDFAQFFTQSGIATMLALFLIAFPFGVCLLWLGYMLGYPLLQPVVDYLLLGQHRAEVLRLLSMAAEKQMSFEATLQNLSSGKPRYGSGIIADRLRRASRLADQGTDWQAALVRVGLLKTNEVPLLHAAAQAGNLPWALRAIADRSVARSIFRWEALQQILFPTATLIIGGLVMWIVVSLFYPLVELIESMT